MSLRTRWIPSPPIVPFLQRLCCVRLRRLKRIEGLTVVFHFDLNLSRLHAKTHLNLVFAVVRVTVGDDVGENFFQGEIEIVHKPWGLDRGAGRIPSESD